VTAVVEAPQVLATDQVPDYCRPHLSSLARADQRRWGETYVRGLVTVPGRKSIRRIADEVVGRRAEQSLQQFVNQSTWKWEPVRRSLADHVTDLVQPRAWVALDAVFPKEGESSVGVARQYVPSLGKVLNCQQGLALCLVGERAGCPVNWRLSLPPCWDDDVSRRLRTHVPDSEQHQPRWRHLMQAVDQTMLAWHLRPMPLLLDATDEPNLDTRLRMLERRGLSYLVRVSPTARAPRWPRQQGRVPAVGEIAGLAGRTSSPLMWQSWSDNRWPGTRIIAASMPHSGQTWFGCQAGSVPQQLVIRWRASNPRDKELWLTNLRRVRLPEMAALLDKYDIAVDALRDMDHMVGLQHFEGRSFPGWHHHVTLASMAYAYTLGTALAG
jgi:SRSO17 transposase